MLFLVNVLGYIPAVSSSSSVCKLYLFPHLVWGVYIYSFKNKYPLLLLTFETSGGRSFSYMTSSPLNKLPAIVRRTNSVSVFMVAFDTHLGHLTAWLTTHSFHFLNLPALCLLFPVPVLKTSSPSPVLLQYNTKYKCRIFRFIAGTVGDL